MTENEVLKIFENEVIILDCMIEHDKDIIADCDTENDEFDDNKELAELSLKDYTERKEAFCMAITALKEVQQYREIGTVEECREAREKQIPKAPIMKPYYEDMPDEEYLCCPTCGDILTDRIPDDNKNFYFHCLNCGQKFDWREDDTK